MKLKKVAALCSSANAFCLFDRVDGDGVVTQWLGDGCCAFPLHGLPVLSEPELYRMFDVSEKKQDTGQDIFQSQRAAGGPERGRLVPL